MLVELDFEVPLEISTYSSFHSFLKSKTVIRHVELPFTSMKPGANARQCAQRGVAIVEQSILDNEWVDQAVVYVTVEPACEAQFKAALPHFRSQQASAELPDHMVPEFDADLANWLVDSCTYVLIDGHHRVTALNNLLAAKHPGLPEKIM
jgi:hypothetical protein